MTGIPDNPNEYKVITSDRHAAALIEQFVIEKHLTKNPDPSDQWLNIVAFPNHKTHYLIFLLFEGFKNEADNGSIVHCFPKSKFTTDQVTDQIKTMLKQFAAENVCVKWVPLAEPEMN